MIDEPALRFTEADTQRLVALRERDWSPAELHRITDGWAAAMILLLAARAELGPADALRDGKARERLFAFFAGEVIEKLGPAQAATLMRIAFLPSASAAMAVAISGDAQAGELLESLAQRSVFTDGRAGTPQVFTFHALFGEFLRTLATRTLGAQAQRALRVEAATILAGHGQADASTAMLIEAEAWPAARALLVAQAAHFLAQGRHAVVREGLLALPEAARDDPQAWYWLGCCELGTDPLGALQHFERAHRGFIATGDALGSFYTAAAAADAIVFSRCEPRRARTLDAGARIAGDGLPAARPRAHRHRHRPPRAARPARRVRAPRDRAPADRAPSRPPRAPARPAARREPAHPTTVKRGARSVAMGAAARGAGRGRLRGPRDPPPAFRGVLCVRGRIRGAGRASSAGEREVFAPPPSTPPEDLPPCKKSAGRRSSSPPPH